MPFVQRDGPACRTDLAVSGAISILHTVAIKQLLLCACPFQVSQADVFILLFKFLYLESQGSEHMNCQDWKT